MIDVIKRISFFFPFVEIKLQETLTSETNFLCKRKINLKLIYQYFKVKTMEKLIKLWIRTNYAELLSLVLVNYDC